MSAPTKEEWMIRSWWYKMYGDRYSLKDIGYWEIIAEDTGFQPRGSLGIVHGTLEKAIEYAIKFESFYAFGHNGQINPIFIQEV